MKMIENIRLKIRNISLDFDGGVGYGEYIKEIKNRIKDINDERYNKI